MNVNLISAAVVAASLGLAACGQPETETDDVVTPPPASEDPYVAPSDPLTPPVDSLEPAPIAPDVPATGDPAANGTADDTGTVTPETP